MAKNVNLRPENVQPCAVFHSIRWSKPCPAFHKSDYIQDPLHWMNPVDSSTNLVPSCWATMNGWSFPELPSPEEENKNASTSSLFCGTEFKTGLESVKEPKKHLFIVFFHGNYI